MDKEFFLNSVIPPPLHFEPTWQSISSSMEISASELNCSPEQSSECFSKPPSWQKSTDRGIHFYSALSSFISSPMAPNSAISTDSYMIRELIGKLGNNIGLSGEISPTSHPLLGNSVSMVTSNSPNTSCSTPLNSTLVDLTADPGFAERAARFSCFGSRSFNGRTSQLGLNSGELPYRSSPSSGNGKLTRVLSSPSLKALGSQLGKLENNKSPSLQRIELEIGSATSDQAEFANSRDESTVSVQNPGDSNPSWGLNSRKRKAMSRGKAREIGSNLTKNDDSTAKRCRSNKSNGNENGGVKEEEKEKGISGDDPHEQGTPPEPPKDYIHVRARRGQATDSHSLAERVRREKISERMKLLQDLVPGCNKVTGKALMLDEIINYVQSLQRQVEFLSMKLASVNFQSDSSSTTDHHLPEMLQSSCPNTLSAYQLESCAPALYESHPQQNRSSSQCSMDPLNAAICQNLSTQLPLLDGFCGGLHQFQSFGEDDLQSVVQMGFGKHLNPSSRTKHLC